jgi:hypothetical protein
LARARPGTSSYPNRKSLDYEIDWRTPSERSLQGDRHHDRFGDPMTTMAAIDRVVHHSVILDLMGMASYRAREATLQHPPPRPPEPGQGSDSGIAQAA